MATEQYGSGTGFRRNSTRRMILSKDLNSINLGASGSDNQVFGSGMKLKRRDSHRFLLGKELKIINNSGIGGGSINEGFGKGTVPWRKNTLRQLEAKTIIALF